MLDHQQAVNTCAEPMNGHTLSKRPAVLAEALRSFPYIPCTLICMFFLH